ncbi:hypothetical protein D3C72_1367220 [compost metagenome]
MGQACRGWQQAQLFEIDEGQAQFMAHQQRQMPPVHRVFVEQFEQRRLRDIEQGARPDCIGVMGARLAIEQADFAEPVRRLDQTQQRLFALLAHRAYTHCAVEHRV